MSVVWLHTWQHAAHLTSPSPNALSPSASRRGSRLFRPPGPLTILRGTDSFCTHVSKSASDSTRARRSTHSRSAISPRPHPDRGSEVRRIRIVLDDRVPLSRRPCSRHPGARTARRVHHCRVRKSYISSCFPIPIPHPVLLEWCIRRTARCAVQCRPASASAFRTVEVGHGGMAGIGRVLVWVDAPIANVLEEGVERRGEKRAEGGAEPWE